MGRPNVEYLSPHACFDCRRSFKRPATSAAPYERKCPYCGGVARLLSRKFKVPPRDDLKQWQKIQFLYENGFRFESVSDNNHRYVRYPETMSEAREFVKKFGVAAPARRTKAKSSK